MTNEALNDAVVRLLADRSFLRRFRRDPEAALRRYGLDAGLVEAIKRGDELELLELGLSPELVWPELAPRNDAVRHSLVRKTLALAPAAFVAALLAAFPATGGAALVRDARVLKAAGRYRRSARAAGRYARIARPAFRAQKRAAKALYPHKRAAKARARARAMKRASRNY